MDSISRICRRVMERLCGESVKLNDRRQYVYDGRTGGCLATATKQPLKRMEPGLVVQVQDFAPALQKHPESMTASFELKLNRAHRLELGHRAGELRQQDLTAGR